MEQNDSFVLLLTKAFDLGIFYESRNLYVFSTSTFIEDTSPHFLQKVRIKPEPKENDLLIGQTFA